MSRAMKDSGIEWIGEVPEGWKVVQLKRYSHVNNGREILEEIDKNENAVPVYGSGGVFKYTNIPLYYGETVMFGRKGTLGKPIYAEGKLWTVDTMYYLTFTNDLSAKFNYYQLLSFDWKPYITHTALPSIVGSEIVSCYFAFPSIKEQQQIADFLDAQCGKIDEVIEKTRETIGEYKKLKQSVITQAVTKGIRPNRPLKPSGIKWIGEIPEDWEIRKIKYVSIFQPTCDTSNLTEESVITYTPMECIKNGYFINNTARYASVAASLTPYENGDIVIAKVTPCFENGNIAIMENLSSGYGLGSSELFVFRPQNIETKYLFYWLRNESFMQQGRSTMTGTGGLKRVSPAFMRNCPITFPGRKEQQEIADYLDEKTAEIDALIARKEQFISEMESYKKSLIYEYVTGKKGLSLHGTVPND